MLLEEAASMLNDGGGWASRGAIGRGGPVCLEDCSRRFDIVRTEAEMAGRGRLRFPAPVSRYGDDCPVAMGNGQAELYISKCAGAIVPSEGGIAEFESLVKRPNCQFWTALCVCYSTTGC